MSVDATVWFCHIARTMNALLDRGHTLEIPETKRHIQDESLFTWLDETFDRLDLARTLATFNQAELFEMFQDMRLVGTER